MGRVLFWLLLGLAAWFAWRLWKDKARLQARRDAELAQRAADAESLVQCRLCGIRLPRSAAVTRGDDHFCGVPHRDEFDRSQ